MTRDLRKWGGSVSIRTKLAAAFGLVFAVVVALGLLGVVQLYAVNRATQEVRFVLLPQVETLQSIKRLTHEHKLLATRRTQTTNFHHLAAAASSMEKTEEALRDGEQSYLASAQGDQERRLFAEFRGHWSEYLENLQTVAGLLEAGELSAASRTFNDTALKHFDGANNALDRLITVSKARAQIAVTEAQAVLQQAVWVAVGGILFAAACVLGTILWANRRVLSPILQVSKAMQRLSGGEKDIAIPGAFDRSDEIGVLANAVSGYSTALAQSRQLVQIVEIERQRLQAAISNMPAGLCMFDQKGRLIICNDLYGEMFRLPSELIRRGADLEGIIRHGTAIDLFSTPLAEVGKRIEASLATKEPMFETLEYRDGRVVSMALQPMADGGWVGVHEDVTEHRRSQERIRYMAHHDALTDLPNRLQFEESLVEALGELAGGETLAVMCLDLDRFKAVNDTLGHPIGDELLRAVAERLRGCLREEDIVARFGGDEFAIIQRDGVQPSAVTAVSRRIIDSISAPYVINGHQIVIGVSVGIALAPADGVSPEALLRNADMALYRAKADGRGTFHFFEAGMDALMQARRKLELDLRHAVAAGQFQLYYQPILRIDDNEVVGLEALIRWSHPEKGIVPPAEFIPLAEEVGLITPLGEWVLRKACHDAASWSKDVKVSVNLSPAQFRNARLVDAVAGALRDSGLPARRLELEITESVLLVDTDATLALLNQLHALGVQIAMDDFGTGYSSLSYFRSFHFDRIKIDASFIHNIFDDASSLAVIRAVTGLSDSLGMATTAEGVETREQLDQLRAEGCKEVQGFLFSPPRPASEIDAMLRDLPDRGEFAA